LGYRRGDFPITEAYAQQILSLPLFPELTAAQLHYVVDNVRDFVVEQPVEQGSQVRELVYA
jgi:dTDP-4-amino-4,6-dideoxygalactose transaminase